MKKLFSLSVVVILATMLTGCGKFECDMCSKEKKGKKHKVEILDKNYVICDDCYEEFEDLNLW